MSISNYDPHIANADNTMIIYVSTFVENLIFYKNYNDLFVNNSGFCSGHHILFMDFRWQEGYYDQFLRKQCS